jgi:heptosyltransferase III
MKILIIQLARLGDIYQTWPVVRAVKRAHPKAEIHFLARKKFAPACEGLSEINKVWSMDTRAILEPLIEEQPVFKKALDQIDQLQSGLDGEKFDKVINLSFSPLSSFITHNLEINGAEVRGYSRHADGFFNPVDDASAYFYSQVGPGRPNRVHLTELFAQVAGVELRDEDWNPGKYSSSKFSKVGAVVVHLGASESKKSYGSHKWLQVVRALLEKSNREVILIGSKEERDLGFVVENVTSHRKPINIVGKTELADLFDILSQAAVLIGCDSGPVHIAALTQTPVLNLSFNSVNFWETGPKSAGSRILVSDVPEGLSSDKVVEECLSLLNGRNAANDVVVVPQNRTQAYITNKELNSLPEWEMIQAVYMGASFPVQHTRMFK